MAVSFDEKNKTFAPSVVRPAPSPVPNIHDMSESECKPLDVIKHACGDNDILACMIIGEILDKPAFLKW